MKKEKALYTSLGCFLLILLAGSFVCAGFSDWFNKITGRATEQQVVLNISVGAGNVPQIVKIDYVATKDLSLGPTSTNIVMNFTAYDADGNANLNDSSPVLNFSKSGETTRQNSTCAELASWDNYVNYSCGITMWWWDGDGVWNITAYIKDLNTNAYANDSETFTINTLTGFVSSPSTLSWATISPGQGNATASNHPIVLNNTGNQNIAVGSIEVNATHLLGEGDNSKGLYAGNFSVGNQTGGSPSAECVNTGAAPGTTMVHATYTGINNATLVADNYTSNDGTAQEQLYFCLKLAGGELSQQAYSTAEQGSWTIRIS